MEIRSLASTGFDEIFAAFSEAFADYEMQLDKRELEAMLTRRGYDSGLSFAAFECGRIVGFTLNGTGTFEGIPTAYDTGTGTVPEYRGRGLAARIFEYSTGFLKEAGIRRYLLEVLQHNEKAAKIYREQGFTVTREFNYFRADAAAVRNEQRAPLPGQSIRPIDIEKYKATVRTFWDFIPSWQNSFGSVRRAGDTMTAAGLFDGSRLLGYYVLEPSTGDIAQMAVDRDHRRRGAASLLLADILEKNRSKTLKVINTDISCGSITAFLAAKNIEITGRQFEMVKTL